MKKRGSRRERSEKAQCRSRKMYHVFSLNASAFILPKRQSFIHRFFTLFGSTVAPIRSDACFFSFRAYVPPSLSVTLAAASHAEVNYCNAYKFLAASCRCTPAERTRAQRSKDQDRSISDVPEFTARWFRGSTRSLRLLASLRERESAGVEVSGRSVALNFLFTGPNR